MKRLMLFVAGALVYALIAVHVSADDPPRNLTAKEREALAKVWTMLLADGDKMLDAGKPDAAERVYRDALRTVRRLHPTGDHSEVAQTLYLLSTPLRVAGRLAEAETPLRGSLAMYRRLSPDRDREEVALALNNLGYVLQHQGRYAEAEREYRDALTVTRRLTGGKDNYDLTIRLNNLAFVLHDSGQLETATEYYREAADVRKRLFVGRDHPKLAESMNNLALVYGDRGKLADAELHLQAATDMWKRLADDRDDHGVATALNNLGGLLYAQRKLERAETMSRDALEMRKRLAKGADDSRVSQSLGNVGMAMALLNQDKLDDAEPFLRDSVEMMKRLLKGRDHPEMAVALGNHGVALVRGGQFAEAEGQFREAAKMVDRLHRGEPHVHVIGAYTNLAHVLVRTGQTADAEPLLRESVRQYRRVIAATAGTRGGEGDALTRISALPDPVSPYLSIGLSRRSDAAAVYGEIWGYKGTISRVTERRHVAARAAATDPKAAILLAALIDTRHRRAELLLAPNFKDPATRKKRDDDLKALANQIAATAEALRPLLSPLDRLDKVAKATASDLRKSLPLDTAMVDFLAYTRCTFDPKKPGNAGETRTPRYLAFVVTKGEVALVDLDTAANIEPAVTAWRAAITGGKEVPTALPAKVRELVWEKVRKELPANIKTLYICPNAALCKVPFAALPGARPNTILLEDFALATIPHAPFLLDQLWPQDERKDPPTAALAVGGVKYDAELAPPVPGTGVKPADPLVKPDAKLRWGFLPGAAEEAKGFVTAARRKKFVTTLLDGDKATTAAVLAELPKARYAHFATHGFFADPSFRSLFDLDPKDYQMSHLGERIGRAANSPLVMTGLVVAGANNPKTPGRGIVTGESLIDLDLSGLELAVLSACETGLGDVAGGEGVFGLQRAFHYAGTRNVVASLWKVDDLATAALMGEFYRNLWTQNLSPMESLRQAQLAVYRADEKQFKDMARRGIGAGSKDLTNVPALPADPKNPKGGNRPELWAAFTLSGLGR